MSPGFKMWRLILLIGIFSNIILLTYGGKPKGKNIFMDWEKFVECPGFQNRDFNLKNMSVFRDDVTALAMRGSFTIENDIVTPPLKFMMTIDRQMPGGGSYRLLSYEVGDLCDKLLQKGTPWESYVRALQPLPPERCPFYKQKYDVNGLRCNLNQFELSKDLVGKYIATLEFFRPLEKPAMPGFPAPLTKFSCQNLHFVIDSE